jgi:hypothetical protein
MQSIIRLSMKVENIVMYDILDGQTIEQSKDVQQFA